MRTIISFMHLSLDGFVAGPKGEMDWIHIDNELFDHVGKRIGLGDTAMYGRNTYQLMESYWPAAGKKPDATPHEKNHSAWYDRIHKIVLSRTLRENELTNTTIIAGDLAGRIRDIKQSGDDSNREILLFGSPTATHSLLQQNLVDGFWLFVNPILLGTGIPLFSGITEKIKLKRMPESRQFASGVIELNYLVER